jgi:hypothetical protein
MLTMILVYEVIPEPLIGFLVHRRDAVDVLHMLELLVPVEMYAVVLACPFVPGVGVIFHRATQLFDVRLMTTLFQWCQFWYILL